LALDDLELSSAAWLSLLPASGSYVHKEDKSDGKSEGRETSSIYKRKIERRYVQVREF
jgi:hypothetical protein